MQQEERDRRLCTATQSLRDQLTSLHNHKSIGSGCLPFAFAATIHGSRLPLVLQELLQNDSLMDIHNRSQLYREVLALLKGLVTFTEFVPIVFEPLFMFRELKEGEKLDYGREQLSLLNLLGTLDNQCSVFLKSAYAISAEADESLGALPIVLEIHHTYMELIEKRKTYNCEGAQPRIQKAGVSEKMVCSDGEQEASSSGTLDNEYVRVLQPLLFNIEAQLSQSHTFSPQIVKTAGGELMRKHLKAVAQEVSMLSTSLPLTFESSIFLAVDECNMDLLRALIIPAQDTPYANGAFVFDIYLPPNYPSVPPKVQFLTTGSGTVSFNPNLYSNGMVCLSLLGTWEVRAPAELEDDTNGVLANSYLTDSMAIRNKSGCHLSTCHALICCVMMSQLQLFLLIFGPVVIFVLRLKDISRGASPHPGTEFAVK